MSLSYLLVAMRRKQKETPNYKVARSTTMECIITEKVNKHSVECNLDLCTYGFDFAVALLPDNEKVSVLHYIELGAFQIPYRKKKHHVCDCYNL